MGLRRWDTSIALPLNDFGPSLLLPTFRDPKYVRKLGAIWACRSVGVAQATPIAGMTRASATAFCGRRRNRVIVVKYPQQT